MSNETTGDLSGQADVAVERADPALSAIEAWARLRPESAGAASVSILKGRKGTHRVKSSTSSVFRLSFSDSPAHTVIAKTSASEVGSWGEGILTELSIYEDVLHQLPIRSPTFHGTVAEPEWARTWIFTEDVGDAAFDIESATHRTLISRYTAAVHVGSRALAGELDLADRSLESFRRRLDEILAVLSNTSFRNRSMAKRRLLADLSLGCRILDARWTSSIAPLDEALGPSLVHCDLVAKNVRCLSTASADVLVAFDWEHAGWGCVAPDLCFVDVAAYLAEVKQVWPWVRRPDVEALQRIGPMLQLLVALSAEVRHGLDYQWSEGEMWRFGYYRDRLAMFFNSVGWRT